MTENRTKGASQLILGSASPRRRDLLARLGMPFLCREATGVDESAVTGRAEVVASTLARRKAEDVLGRLLADSGRDTESWRVLGADTLVALGDGESEEVFGKPRDSKDAVDMLTRLSGRTHRVYTGVALARSDLAAGEHGTQVELECTPVTFRALLPGEIAAYVASGEPLGKAGAYAIQGRGGKLVATVHGCVYNVVGLPLTRTANLLDMSWRCDCRGCAR